MKTQNTMQKKILPGLRDERGAGLLEYALIIGLITVASITAVSLVGGSVAETFDTAAASLAPADTNAAADDSTATNRIDGKVKRAEAAKDDTLLTLSKASPATRSQAPSSVLSQASSAGKDSTSTLSQASSSPRTALVSGSDSTKDRGKRLNVTPKTDTTGSRLTKDTGSQGQNRAPLSVLRLSR